MSVDFTDLNRRRSDFHSVMHVGGYLAFVFAPVFLAAYIGNWPSYAIGFIWFGLSQNGVANLMHEAAHRLLFHQGKWSDVLGHRVLAPFFLTNFELYRRRHWVHHNHIGTEHDTKTIYTMMFGGIASFLAFAARCAFGIEAVKRFANTQQENKFVKPLTGEQKKQGLLNLVTFHVLFAIALLLVAYGGSGGDWQQTIIRAGLAYGVVYIYAMATMTILLSTLRSIAEHQIVGPADVTQGHASLRNMRPTLATRFLFGSYGFCEHATHHEHPTIPYYNLRQATQELAKDEPELACGPTYGGVIMRAVFDRVQYERGLRLNSSS